jgi:hypothetical protein
MAGMWLDSIRYAGRTKIGFFTGECEVTTRNDELSRFQHFVTQCLALDPANDFKNFRTRADADTSIEKISEFYDLLRALENVDPFSLPTAVIRKAANRIEGVYSVLLKANSLPTDSATSLSHATSEFNHVVSSIEEQYKLLYIDVAPLLNHPRPIERNLGGILLQASCQQKEMASKIEEFNSIIADARATTDSYNHLLEVSATTKYAIIFRRQARKHRRIARHWMLATISCAALAVSFAVFATWFNLSLDNAPIRTLIHASAAELTCLSLITFAMIWCSRSYRAHQHLQSLNRHRHNAMTTFRAFRDAAEGDADTRNAVLLQATNAVFSVQPSGFLGLEPMPKPYPPVLQLARAAAGSSDQ